MTKAPRSVIKLLARHSDWRTEEVDEALKSEVYADKSQWHWLLRLLLLALGLGFLASGILFFFAYNWADIPKFGKLTLAGLAVVITAILALIPSLSELVRKCMVTTAAFLVGPFFGVFGQIYQTGANAYDLFFGWVVFIAIWVIAVDFAPLWLLFVALLNVTLSLYAEQIATDWPHGFTMMLHFGLNGLALFFTLLRTHFTTMKQYPDWLPKLFGLAAVMSATIACGHEIIEDESGFLLLMITLTLAGYGLTTLFSFRQQELYYLALIAFSLIAIITTRILQWDNEGDSFFLATIWVMLSVAGSIYGLNNLRKKWQYD